MDVTIILFALATFLLTRWIWGYLSQPTNLPPGPWQYPVFGFLLDIKWNPNWYKDFTQYRKQYGDIFRLKFGPHHAVIIHGMDRIKETFIDNADFVSERPQYQVLVSRLIGYNGIIYGTDWKATRKIVMHSFREFGAGPKSAEEIVKSELSPLLNAFDETEGEPFDCKMPVTCAVSNVTCTVVFGERNDYGSEEFRSAIVNLDSLISWRILSISNFVWWTSFVSLLMNCGQVIRLQNAFKGIEKFINTRVKQHKETYDPDNIRDFIDIHIQASEHGKTKVKECDSFAIIFDLFAAGTETTSTTIRWFFAYMLHFPAIQEKCYQDIMQCIGPDREVTMNDKTSMVYFDAMLQEILRITNIAPFPIPHVASETVEVGGYTIPKGTLLLANLYDLHHSQAVWGDPDTFRPERWIDEAGKLKKNTDTLPFGIGRRACIGEQLARTEIFVFTVTLLQRFKFKAAGSLPDMTPIEGVTLAPKPFKMIAESRRIE